MESSPAGRVLTLLVSGLLILFGLQSALHAERIFPSENESDQNRSSSSRILPSEQQTEGNSSDRILPGESGTAPESVPSGTSTGERILPSESMNQTGTSSPESGSEQRPAGEPSGEPSSQRLLPTTEEPVSSVESSTGPSEPDRMTSTQSPEAPNVRYNPNTVSVDDLAAVPGLSRVLAERIEWYRREVGPFQDRNDLRKVPGIDRRIYRKVSNYFHQGPYR